MIIKVEQTESNFKNKFEIKVNNELKYLAGTPWMDISLPLNIENVRRCTITKTDESICYTTSYDIIENVSNTAIPMKWAFTGEQKSRIYNIYDNEANIAGKFYKLTNGFLNTKYVIEYKNYTLKAYDVSIGKTRNISIYNEEGQIAEIIKPLHAFNNLDYYYLFLLDQYSDLETILSFFTVFFDYQNYSHHGEIVVNKNAVGISYTYSKNNKFYDKNWIINHFDKDEVDKINNQIFVNRKNNTSGIKKQTKYTLLFVALFWLMLFIVFGILYYIYYL